MYKRQILFLVELFVIPGISVAGFLAGGCIIFANYYAFAYMGTTAAVSYTHLDVYKRQPHRQAV